MKTLKKLALTLVTTLTLVIVVFSAIIYIVWIPSPQEPPYQLLNTWGQMGRDPGQFNEPTGIAVTDDAVFVSDSRNRRIQVFDHNGQFLRQFGHQVGAASENLERPMNLTIAGQQLYVADYFSDMIKVYTLDGEFVRSIGRAGNKDGQFNAPGGAAVAPNGDVYVADFLNQRIQLLNNNGKFIRQWGKTEKVGIRSGEFNYPTDVAVNHPTAHDQATNAQTAQDQAYLFVADGYNDRIQVFSSNGEYLYKWGGPFGMNIFGRFNGWFATVTGIAIGPKGNVFVADFYNDRVQKFSNDGTFLTVFGIPGKGQNHTAIAVDIASDGTVFVADYANHQIQVWQASGL